ncbi:HD domain-containing protein [Abditibacterium utsteinense]|uniref:HD domain-containing protein n=1 Tax=Abditibacterium utsteinense TaxID=1960156 RepID=A0A2S8SXI7_9BACT|nr:HD domain-containing phosphohydrolase [Abditibacterium utsteinense]PQV65515.1 HD domain-containing protein [Abditibacterium utsteinense]
MMVSAVPNLTASLQATVEALMTAIEARDADLRRHSERVARYAVQIALSLNFEVPAQHQIYLGALLHDIGNIGIPDSILLKPSGLTSWEFDEMKLHGIIGETICRPLPELAGALPLIRSHHEKLDGTGYPDALQAEQIGVAVRVLSVADVYDTLRCERAYRDAFPHEQAIEILHQEAKRGWWDAQIVARLADLTAQ